MTVTKQTKGQRKALRSKKDAPTKRDGSIMSPRESKQKDTVALTMDDLEAHPFRCPNCSVALEGLRLYCSELCAQEAGWVRKARRYRVDGRDQDPQVKKEGLDILLALILGGGYPERARRLPESVRKFIFERDQGKCRTCGQPGKDIDHISGSSGDPANLQLLCKSCHNKKTVAQFRKITKDSHPEEWAKAQRLKFRAAAKEPMQLCDSRMWNDLWKDLMRKRLDFLTGQHPLFE
jgi:hypothetical protein